MRKNCGCGPGSRNWLPTLELSSGSSIYLAAGMSNLPTYSRSEHNLEVHECVLARYQVRPRFPTLLGWPLQRMRQGPHFFPFSNLYAQTRTRKKQDSHLQIFIGNRVSILAAQPPFGRVSGSYGHVLHIDLLRASQLIEDYPRY
jgi:hypothetical protein